MGFLELLIICGTTISLYAIYMEYRSKGYRTFDRGSGKKDMDELRGDIREIRANLEHLRESVEQVRELNADMLIELERKQTISIPPESEKNRQ